MENICRTVQFHVLHVNQTVKLDGWLPLMCKCMLCVLIGTDCSIKCSVKPKNNNHTPEEKRNRQQKSCAGCQNSDRGYVLPFSLLSFKAHVWRWVAPPEARASAGGSGLRDLKASHSYGIMSKLTFGPLMVFFGKTF